MLKNPEDFFQNKERELALAIQQQTAYVQDVETQIINQSFILFPAYEGKKSTITKRLRKELHENVLMLNDTIEDLLLNENQNETANQTEFTLPPLPKFETIEQELEFELSKSTPPHTLEFISEMKACIKEERTKREFLLAIYNQIMQTTFNHFPKIIDLSGNSIRNINYTAYTIANLHTEGFFYQLSNQ